MRNIHEIKPCKEVKTFLASSAIIANRRTLGVESTSRIFSRSADPVAALGGGQIQMQGGHVGGQ